MVPRGWVVYAWRDYFPAPDVEDFFDPMLEALENYSDGDPIRHHTSLQYGASQWEQNPKLPNFEADRTPTAKK